MTPFIKHKHPIFELRSYYTTSNRLYYMTSNGSYSTTSFMEQGSGDLADMVKLE